MNGPRFAALCLAAILVGSTAVSAQNASSPAPASASSSSSFSPAQLDELVAPIALYPDPLLADVLTASTYPLEVIDADRWVGDSQNAELTGDDLTAALDGRGWDPSVQSLVPFPQVLQLMDGHLDWMETLGEAFLAQPGDVMDAVQRMRQRAQSAGNLPTDGEETVTDQGNMIAIWPPADLIYVPQYDPWCAFGAWSDPLSPPFYFSSWSGTCEPAEYGIEFGPGIAWPFPFWGWAYFDWHHHRLMTRPDLYRRFHPEHMPKTAMWQHDPQHREGAPYRNPRNAHAFGQLVAQRQPFRASSNAPAPLVRSRPPVRNWNAGRVFQPPPRPAAPGPGGFRPGFARPAHIVGRGGIAEAPGR